jgi:hypothetical protein
MRMMHRQEECNKSTLQSEARTIDSIRSRGITARKKKGAIRRHKNTARKSADWNKNNDDGNARDGKRKRLDAEHINFEKIILSMRRQTNGG